MNCTTHYTKMICKRKGKIHLHFISDVFFRLKCGCLRGFHLVKIFDIHTRRRNVQFGCIPSKHNISEENLKFPKWVPFGKSKYSCIHIYKKKISKSTCNYSFSFFAWSSSVWKYLSISDGLWKCHGIPLSDINLQLTPSGSFVILHLTLWPCTRHTSL